MAPTGAPGGFTMACWRLSPFSWSSPSCQGRRLCGSSLLPSSGPVVGSCMGSPGPIALLDLARLIEERLALQARLSTALEYHDRQDRSPFALVLYRDAFRVLPLFRGKEILPVCLPRGRPGRGSAPNRERDDGPESPDLMRRVAFLAVRLALNFGESLDIK